MLMSILAPIVVFGIIVLVHEGGHFAAAKLTGMRVDEFAIGFGPAIWSKKVGETLYSLRLIPLGGYNKIAGMEANEADMPRSFASKPVWVRLFVISAGSLMNILLAFCIFTGITYSLGVQSYPDRPIIGSVIAGSPAERAGLTAGDILLTIDGKPVENWMDISENLKDKASRIVPVTYERAGEIKEISLIPQESEGRTVVGIMAKMDSRPISLGEAFVIGTERSLFVTRAVLEGIAQMVTGAATEDISGPIGIARMAGSVAEIGFLQFLLFIGLISLNLGLLNLFPIPLLDGGLLVLTLCEAIIRRQLPERALYYIQAIGIAILVGLFLLGTMNDMTRMMK
jgi:regulator of sigma E protease